MATAEEKEADRAAQAFALALIYLGLSASQDAQDDWSAVPPVAGFASAAWLRASIRKVVNRSRMGRDLAFAFYRLDRALRTGETIKTPDHPEPEVSVDDLREEFYEIVTESVPKTPSVPREHRQIVAALEPSRPKSPDDSPPSPGGKKETVKAVEIPGLNRQFIERYEKDLEQEAEGILKSLGPENMDRKIRKGEAKIRKSKREKDPLKAAKALRDAAHSDAGARVAATSDRMAKNGARGILYEVGKADKKAIGFVRASRTGTPCGFCAMLISRGFVLYKSRKTAGDYKGNEFHDNCNCYAIPVFSREHYETSPLFAMNRDYHKLWPVVTKGKGGEDALNAWRRYMNRLHGRTFNKSAQAADAA